MAQRDQVLGMFGASPEQIMARIRREQAQEVLQTQDPFQRAGGAIGLGLARMFGGEPEEVTRQRRLQETLQGIDMTNPDQMTQAASILNQTGFPNEAMQLLARADDFRTSAQQRSTSEAQQAYTEQQTKASEAEVRRGQYNTVEETIAHPVTIDGQTFYVPIKARVRYDLDTGKREVQTESKLLDNQAQAGAAKMQREELAAQSEQTLREAQLTAAQKQAALAEKQLTQAERDANITTGLVRVPVEEEIKDLAGRVTGYRTGFEYKPSKGRMVTDENGKETFQPFLTDAMPVAEAVDETGLPQNAVKIEEGKQTTIKSTVSGQEFVVVGAGDEAQYYQIITEGDNKYYIPTPESAIDPKTINLQQPTEETEQPTQSNLGRKGQMSRGTTMTEQPEISSRPRTQKKR